MSNDKGRSLQCCSAGEYTRFHPRIWHAFLGTPNKASWHKHCAHTQTYKEQTDTSTAPHLSLCLQALSAMNYYQLAEIATLLQMKRVTVCCCCVCHVLRHHTGVPPNVGSPEVCVRTQEPNSDRRP